MDPEQSQHAEDVVNHISSHLEKQHELLIEARRTITQELKKLEVEEEMMLRKYYELMSTHRLNNKKMEETQNVSQGKEKVEVEVDASSSSRNINAKK